MILGNYFLLEYPKNQDYEIKLNKKLSFKWDNELIENLDKQKIFYKKLYGVEIYRDKMKKQHHMFNFNFRPYYQGLFNLEIKNYMTLNISKILNKKDMKKNTNNIDNKDFCCKLRRYKFKKMIESNNYKNKKFKFIWSNMVTQDVMDKLDKLSYCKILDVLYYSYLSLIDKLNKYLEIGGSLYFALYEQPCDKKSVEIIYLLSLLFDKIIIMSGKELLCINYRGEERLKREEFKKIKESNTFSIEPLIEIDDLQKYYKIIVKDEIERLEYLVTDQYTKLYPLIINKGIKDILFSNYDSEHFLHFIGKINIIFDKRMDYKTLYKYLEKEYNNQINDLEKIIKKESESKNINIIEIGIGLCIYTKVFEKNKNINLILNEEDNNKNNMIHFSKEYIKKKNKINSEELKVFIDNQLKKYENKIDIILINKRYELKDIKKELKKMELLMKKDGLLIIDRSVNQSNLKLNDYIKNNFKNLDQIENNNFYIYKLI